MDVDGRDVVLLGRHLQLLVELGLVLDAVVGQRGVHVQRLALALPGVALRVHVDLLVAVQDLPDGLLPGHFEPVLRVAEGVDNSDELALLGELADEVLLVLPPGDGQRVADELQVQEPAMRDVELLLALRVDECAWLFGLLVEPAGDVGACGLDDGLYLSEMPALLDEVGEVVDVVEEAHPDVVGRVVALQLREDVVPSLVVGLGHQLLYLVCCTLFRH